MTDGVDRAAGTARVDTAIGWAGLACSAAVIAWWLTAGLPAPEQATVSALVHVPAGLVAAYLTLRVARRSEGEWVRKAWSLFALASALLVLVYALQSVVSTGPAGVAVVRLASLLPLLVVVVALMKLPPSVRRTGDPAAHGLDVTLITTGASMLVWELMLRQGAGLAGDDWSRLPAGAVAIGDLCVVAGVASLLLRSPADSRRISYLFLAGAHLWLLLSDLSMVGGGAWSALHHPGRALYTALLIVATLVELRRLRVSGGRGDVVVVQPMTALPYIAAGTGAVMLLLGAVRGGRGQVVLALAAATLTALSIARLLLAQRETTRLRRERTVLASDARFRSLVEQSADMIFVVDQNWTVTYASPSVLAALGYRTAHLVGSSVLDFVHPEEVADAAGRLRECLADSRPMRGRWRLRRNDQTYIHAETVCANLVRDEYVHGIVLTARDVSERTSLEAQLTHRAFHDPLTGLANRALFEDRVQHALARRRGDVGRLGVVFMDLDYFKAVNDELGHAAGDALLRAAAQRLVSGLRAFDTAARLGGDEFAVLIDDITRHEEVMQVAERIARTFGDPFVFDGREITTSASVGVAMATAGYGADELLRNADLAMYLAKKRGRGQAVLFEPEMHAAATTRQELQRDLAHALERGELSLVYHPIHALDTQVMIGAEALLRWVHPTRGPIPPSTFVPIAEESGLMVEIGHWVIRTACLDAQAWRSRPTGPLPLQVWINLSVRQLPEQDLYDHVAQAISGSGIVPGAVVLELTERMLLLHKDRALQLMERLKSLGIGLAIDDFGTGYSSLADLQKLPIDILKIDRTFVDAIASDEHASTLARTVVSLGELMSLAIVAEGIENQEQAERLRALGCNAGQGYLFGMPVSAADLPAYADRYRSFSAV